MTFIPDNSGNGNQLALNGNSQLTEGLQEKKVNFKSLIRPEGTNAIRAGDRFGEILDIFENTIIAGTPAHKYDAIGGTTQNDRVGAAWIFQKIAKPFLRRTQLKQRHKQVFSYTGSLQSFTVPDTIERLSIQLIGAGGGGNTLGTFAGGNGGYVKADILVRPGHTYNLIVGQGGVAGGTTRPFGGGGCLTAAGGIGGSGGGRTALADPIFGDLITAGGGGGAGKDGPGGYGGLKAGAGKTVKTVTHPVDVSLNAQGASGYITGYTPAMKAPNYVVVGASYDLKSNILNNTTYFDDKYKGENASPATSISGNVYENGAGGGGFAGGAAGPDGYGYRTDLTATPTYYSVGGSGSGGSSMAEPTIAFAPYITEENMVTNVVTYDGDKLSLNAEFDGFGNGGTGSTPGGNGQIIIEWDEYVESDDQNLEERWVWKQMAKVTPVGFGRTDNCVFGSAVAVYGDWAFVGAPGQLYTLAGTNGLADSGAVWVYKNVDGVWTQMQVLQPTGTNARNANDRFGASVSVVDGKLFVGAPGHSYDAAGANAVSAAGAVFTYTLSADTWTQSGKIIPTGTNARIASDNFGYKIKANGTNLVVSSKNGYDASGVGFATNAGAAFVYDISGTPTQVARLADARIANSAFGSSIAIKEKLIVVEASGISGMYFYQFDGTDWVLDEQSSDNPVNDYLMYSEMTPFNSLFAINGKNFSYSSATNVYDSYVSGVDRSYIGSPTMNFATGPQNGLSVSGTQPFLNLNSFTFEQWVHIVEPFSVGGTDKAGALLPMVRRKNRWGLFNVRDSGEANGGRCVFRIEVPGSPVVWDFGKLQRRTWTHLAVVRDGDNVRLYTNGVLVNTYNVANITFEDDNTNLTFGYDGSIENVPSANFYAREFSVRTRAVYNQTFTPSITSYSISSTQIPLTDNARGRGTSTYIYDTNTVMSGLPLSATFEPVKIPDRIMNLATTAHVESAVKGSGQVEIINRFNDSWTKLSNPVVAPGHVMRHSGNGSGFGQSVFIDKDKLIVTSPNDSWSHSGNFDTRMQGTAYLYDTQNDFEFKTKIVPKSRDSATNTNRFFGYHGSIKDGTFVLGDYNFATRTPVYLDFVTTTTSGSTYVPYNVKTTYAAETSGRLVDVGTVGATLVSLKDTILKVGMNSANFTVANLATETDTYGTFFSVLPGSTYFATIVSPFSFIDGKVYYVDQTGTRVNADWDNTTSGFLARMVQDPITYNYTYTQEFSYPGSSVVNRLNGDKFGYSVKVNGDSIFVGEYGSDKGAKSNSTSGDRGAIFRYEYVPHQVGWDTVEAIFPDTNTGAINFGYSIDTYGDYLITRSAGLDRQTFILKNDNGYQIEQKFSDGPTTINYVVDSVGFFEDGRALTGSPDATFGIKTNVGYASFYSVDNGVYTKDTIKYQPKNWVDDRDVNYAMGTSVAMEGDTVIVGAPGYNKVSNETVINPSIGAGFVYKLVDGQWEQQAKLLNEANVAGTEAGAKVTIKGDKFLTISSQSGLGLANMFERDGTDYVLDHVFSNPLVGTTSAAILGDDHIVMGQPLTGPKTLVQMITSGSFTDFTLSGATWTKGSNWFTPAHTNGAYDQNAINYASFANNSLARNMDDMFGTAVKLSADKQMLLIGAPNHQFREDPSSDNPSYHRGAVFAYYWDADTSSWRLNHKLSELGNNNVEPQFGYVINSATDSSFVISSKIFNDLGEITRYELTGSGLSATWTNTFNYVNTTVSQFGADVVWDATRELYYVGLPKRTENNVSSGTFEVLIPGTTVSRQSYNNDGNINNRTVGDQFGYSVSVNGNSLAIGAPGFDYNLNGTVQNTGKGAAFVYKVTKGGVWTYEQKVTFEGNSSASFGAFVGINDKTLFVQGKDLTPVVFDRDVSGKFVPVSVTGNNAITLDPLFTARRYAWDPITKTAATVSTSGSFNVPQTPVFSGGAVAINYNSSDNSYSVATNGLKPVTITGTGTVEPLHLLSATGAGFAESGMALSSDASMLAIASAADANNLYTNAPELAYTAAGSIGKVFIYRYNVALTKYEYHSMIKNPFPNTVNEKIGLSWVNDTLSVTYPLSGRVLNYKLYDDRFWKAVSNAAIENTTASSVLALDGNALVLANPKSNGYPNVTQSGAVRVQLFNEGVWGSSRGINAGADAEAYRSDIGGGGGGAGAIGGKAASGPNGRFGGLGGTNFVPTSGQQFLSNGAAWARSDAHATGAGGLTPGANGEDARVVVSYNGTDVVFDYTGFDQAFTVPADVTSIDVSLWGAGGGAANLNAAFSASKSGKGGAGANVTATLAVTPGETLTLMVGAGGRGGDLFTSNSNRNQKRKYGLGGLGGVSSLGNVDGGGSGGGLAAIKRGDDFLAIAGGGGGGSATHRSLSANTNGVPAGYNVPQDFANTTALIDDGDAVYAPGIINSRNALDFFGHSVAIADENFVLIGAPGHEFDAVGDGLPLNSGVVFGYKRINGKWQLLNKFTSGNSVENENFGTQITMQDDKLLVLGNKIVDMGADLNNLLPSTQTVIELLQRDGDAFISLAKKKVTDEANLGVSAALAGDDVVVGNPLRDTDGVKPLITKAGGFTTWDVTVPTLTALNSVAVDSISFSRFDGDLFGSAVEITNSQILVGAPGHDYTLNGASFRSGQGALFVFDKKGANYVYRDKLSLESNSTLTGFGKTLKLIGDKLYAGTDAVNKLVELSNTAGSWSISKHIEASIGNVARMVSTTMLMELDPNGGAGVGSQPTLAGAGRAKTFTVDQDGLLVDANADYTIPGNSRGRNLGDQFGYSVYANHDFVVVGSPNNQYDVQGNDMQKTGTLYVFNKQGDAWVPEAKLVPEVADKVGFGYSLSGRNGWVVTGGLDSTNGIARVFQRVAEGNWQTRKTYTGTGVGGDAFGAAVAAADTNKFVVGLPNSDLTSVTGTIADSGTVQTFERIVDAWYDRGQTGAPGLVRGRNAGDWFGFHVAANKNFVVIGSPQYAYDENGENQLDNAGAVWIHLNNPKYSLISRYVSPTRAVDARFGTAVGIDSQYNRIAVGEPGTNSVHVFAFDGLDMTLEQTLTVDLDDGEVFGTTLAFNDGKIAVGSSLADTDANGANPLDEAGAVYVWERDNSTGTWNLKEKITGFTNKNGTAMANSREAGDHFGAAVAIDAKGSLIIGSPDHNWDNVGANEVADAGAVFIKKIK